MHEYGIDVIESPLAGRYDAIVLAVAHDQFRQQGAFAIRAHGRPVRRQAPVSGPSSRWTVVKTDTLFHELFRQWPAVALDLAGLDPGRAAHYRFRSEELKQAAFRIDGVLAPIEDGDDPHVFIEVQFQPDDTLYRRLFAEIFLYLQRLAHPREWRALVLYSSAGIERIPRGYANLLSLPEVRRVDLSVLSGQDSETPGWDLLRLIIDDTDVALARAAEMIQRPVQDLELLNSCLTRIGSPGFPCVSSGLHSLGAMRQTADHRGRN